MSNNPTVFEYAKEIGLETLTLMDKIRKWQLPIKSHMATLGPELLDEIKRRLDEEGAKGAKPKSKVVKRAAAVTKPSPTKSAPKAVEPSSQRPTSAAAEKTTEESGAPAKEAQPLKRKPLAKKPVKKPVVAAEKSEKEELTGGDLQQKKSVIRRRAIDKVAMEMQEAAKAKLPPKPSEFEEVASAAEQSAEMTMEESAAEGTIDQSKGVVAPSPESQVEPRQRRQNIVGRMDLNRVRPREATSPVGGGFGSGGGTFAGGARPQRSTGGARTLRTGFVAPEPVAVEPVFEKNRKEERTSRKRLVEGAAIPPKDLTETVAFNVTEFRKREMVFQPKKKKGLLSRESKKTQITTPKASKRVVRIHEAMKLADLAQEMGVKAAELVKKLMSNGVMANMNTLLDFDTVALIVPEFGFEAINVHKTAEDLVDASAFGDLTAELTHRPPVVTVMGHVDHGKTTLLDAIRQADVAGGEAGGITQHIGAYNVHTTDGHQITFVDTPGHAAFTAMRARGAHVTDIVVLVVAADDGVMPQTVEAINHAKAAEAPIIVAVNKMDRHGASMDRIKQQLMEHELVSEEWGGSTIFCPVSALKKQGINELLGNILVVAEMLELKANPQRSATGVVIESARDRGRGNVVTLLVQDGTLKLGQVLVAGQAYGKVRSLSNDHGKSLKEALPGTPVEVLGFSESPAAGDRFDVCRDEATAREIVTKRALQESASKSPMSTEKTLEAYFSKAGSGQKELRLILKSDVAGSNEAIVGMFEKLTTDEVKIRVVHSAVGGITESDIMLASASGAIVIGFNIRPGAEALALAKEKQVEIKTYTIIYELNDDMKKMMSGLIEPEFEEKVVGRLEVRNTFVVPKAGTIAGSFVVDGKISRDNLLRLVRDGKIIYQGRVSSLKRFKDDVKEVASGYECGVGIANFNDIKVGDVIEALVKEQVVVAGGA